MTESPVSGAARRCRQAVPYLFIVFMSVALAGFVLERRGNLAWDDADYLRRGLTNVAAATDGGFAPLRLILDTLRERPKPPLLVGWIELGALLLGRRALAPLLVFATVLPYAILATAVASIARRRFGPRAGWFAIPILLASPMGLSYGAKVMVETFMGLWILLVYDRMAALLASPRPRRAALLGLVLGAAMLTKLTVALLLPVPGLLFLEAWCRRHGFGREGRRLAILALACTSLVAGPWYARNTAATVKFAVFSSRYNIVAEGRTDSVPRLERLAELGRNLPGGALIATLASVALASRRRRDPREETTDTARMFTRLAVSGAVSGALILLLPSYFDPRFLLPIWPALAVVLGGLVGRFAVPGMTLRTTLTAGALGLCVVVSARGLVREPRTSSYWTTRLLIDDLVRTRGVRTIGNVGNTPEWNVCKTGLFNAMRERPGDCFVLHDLSRSDSESLTRRLPKFDAVFVLDGGAVPSDLGKRSPGLNRARETAARMIAADDRFERMPVRMTGDLPGLSVYIRRR